MTYQNVLSLLAMVAVFGAGVVSGRSDIFTTNARVVSSEVRGGSILLSSFNFESSLSDNESFVDIPGRGRFGLFRDDHGEFFELGESGVVRNVSTFQESFRCGLQVDNKSPLDEYGAVDKSKHRLLQLIPFGPGCFPFDSITRTVDIAIVVDNGYFLAVGGSTNAVVQNVAIMMANARLLYKLQLNVALSVSYLKVVLDPTKESFPVNMLSTSGTCVSDYDFVVESLGNWASSTNNIPQSGLVHLLTACWPSPGVVGIAYVGTLCRGVDNVGVTSFVGMSNTWLIFVHEIGHGFGALHTFMNGVGTTGGIMDYGDPYYNKTIQFHPANKAQICPTLSSIPQTCPFFRLSDTGSCGDGILSDGEQCECLDLTKTCQGCKGCLLESPATQCSTSGFVLVGNSQLPVAVTPGLLSDSECCSNGLFDMPQSCSGGSGVCANGACLKLCSLYLLESCNLEENGCTSPCKQPPSQTCISTLVTQTTHSHISWLPDNTMCFNSDKRTQGQCKSGVCVPLISSTLIPSVPQTFLRKTSIPTRLSSLPTRRPTPQPEIYEFASPSTSPFRLTCGPTSNDLVCRTFSTRSLCLKNHRLCSYKKKLSRCGNNCKFYAK